MNNSMRQANKSSNSEAPRASSRQNGIFEGMFAAMNSHVQSLSGEVAEAWGSQMIGSGEPQPHLSILGSTNPSADCATILWLFPHKFTQVNSPEAFLLQEKENPSTGTSIMLIFCGVDAPLQWRNAVVILEDVEISGAINRCHHRAASVFHQESIEISRNQYATLAVIRMTGGSNLILLANALIKSQVGRAALADFVTSRDLIESNEPRGSSALQEEAWMNEIEEEFSFRRLAKKPGKNTSFGTIPSAPFPTLKVSLLRKHGFLQQDIPINSKNSLMFETDLFVGKMVLLMQPSDPEDGLHKLFSSDTNSHFILQIQGKFKYAPTGTVFAGVELTCDELKPALVTKGLCVLLLKSIKKKHPDVHSSYGDGVEKPHIVVPAWTFFDRIVRTKPSDRPPSIEEPFCEPSGSVNARRNSGSKGAWNNIDTYSFTFFSSFLDFPSWQMVNVPYFRESSLHNFWDDSMVRLVLYEQRDSVESSEQGLHKPTGNSYLFSLQLEHIISEAENEMNEEVDKWESSIRTMENFGESFRSDISRQSINQNLSDDDDMFLEGESDTSYVNGDQCLVKPVISSLPSKDLLAVVNSFCPAWFDMITNDKKYTKVYAFRHPKQATTLFRSLQQFQRHLDVKEALKYVSSVCSTRISNSELTRRVLGYAYCQGQTSHAPKVRQFTTTNNKTEAQFLRRAEPENGSNKFKQKVLKSGFIARALSDHHWREEYVLLLDHHIAFLHPDNLKPHFRINLKSVIKGKKLKPEDGPDMPGYFFLELDTIGRRIYLMFLTERMREEWTMAMNEIILRYRKTEGTSNRLDGIENPVEQFMHKSSMWTCNQRILLNCRHFPFRSLKTALAPSELLEEALLLAYEAQETSDENVMIHFLDKASELKNVDIYHLQGIERLAFLLNLYHLMVIHSYLLLGPPESSATFVKMMHMVSYEVSDDIFSLAELELNIIRGSASYPIEFAPRFVLPKSRYGFALDKMDIRVNFALNCGSKSAPKTVPIYKATTIEMQLDAAAVKFLEVVNVELDEHRLIVTLPRLFLWYSEDFGPPFDMMVKIAPFLNESNQDQLRMAGFNKRIVLIHNSFDFQCRPLDVDDTLTQKFRQSQETMNVAANTILATVEVNDAAPDGGLVMEPEISDSDIPLVLDQDEVSAHSQEDFVEASM